MSTTTTANVDLCVRALTELFGAGRLALAEGAGFATGSKALVIIAFAVLLLGLLQAVRTIVASPAPRLAAAGAKAAAVS